jgi:hypothetical protein
MSFERMSEPNDSQRATRRMDDVGDMNIDAGIPTPPAPQESGVREKSVPLHEQLGLTPPVPSGVKKQEIDAEIAARGTMTMGEALPGEKELHPGELTALGTVPPSEHADMTKPPFVASRLDDEDIPQKKAA